MASKMLTIKQLLEKYPYSARDIRRKLQSGKIKGMKPEGKWLITEEEVHRLLGHQGVIKSPPLTRLVDLLQRWRGQLLSYSLDWLLWKYKLEDLPKTHARHLTQSQKADEIYRAAQRYHVQTMSGPVRLLLPVAQEGLFHRLRQCYPDDPVWETQDSWELTCGACVEAFCSWSDEVTNCFEAYLTLALMDDVAERDREVASGKDLLDQLQKEDVNWLVLVRLASVVISCDLLTLGIEELPTNLLWFFQVDKLRILRAEVVNQSAKLLKEFWVAQHDIGAVARLLWEHQGRVQESTRDLLQKLQRLQAAQDDLCSKLTGLEWRLYDVAQSPPL